jgi:predicted porin
MPDFSLIGMYNSYNYDSAVATDVDKMDGWLAGVTYNYNKNVTFIVNYLSENKDLNNGTKSLDKDSIMATAEVKW